MEKKEIEIYMKYKEEIIKILAKIVNKEKFSEKEIKKASNIRNKLKFGFLEYELKRLHKK